MVPIRIEIALVNNKDNSLELITDFEYHIFFHYPTVRDSSDKLRPGCMKFMIFIGISPKFDGAPIVDFLPCENAKLFIYVMAILISSKVPPFRIHSKYL